MKTCKRGHAINARNSYVNAAGRRICRVCVREIQRQRYTRDFRSLGVINSHGALK